eukprot:4693901-Karenia_brevis.AAC.1
MHKYDKDSGVIPNELRQELEWAASRYSTRCDELTDETTFLDCLSQYEYDNVTEYRRMYPNAAWQINQDVQTHAMHSNGPILHTLTKGMGIILCDTLEQDKDALCFYDAPHAAWCQ